MWPNYTRPVRVFLLGYNVKIDFEFETPYGKFADALWFSDEEPTPSDTEIEILKQQRLNDWLAALTAPTQETLVEAPPEVVA